jgi:hypothetical protein
MAMSAALPPPLAPACVLGFRPSVRSPLHWMSDGELMMSVGPRTLSRFDVDTRTQSLLHASPEAVAITAIAVSPGRGQVLVAEFHHDGASALVLHELGDDAGASSATPVSPGGGGGGARRRRRRAITGVELGSGPVTALNFTPDGRHFLVASAGPNVTLSYVAWGKGAVVATAKGATGPGPGCTPTHLPIAQVDACVQDPSRILASGGGTIRLFTHSAGDEKLAPAMLDLRGEPPPAWTCHAWVNEDRFLAGTAAGEVWVFQGGSVLKRLACGGKKGAPPSPVASLLPLGSGFLAGCEGGFIKLFEKSEVSTNFYSLAHSAAISVKAVEAGEEPLAAPPGAAGRVVALAVTPSEDGLAAATAGGGVYTFSFAKLEASRKGGRQDFFAWALGNLHPFWCGAQGQQSRAEMAAQLASGGAPPPVISPLGGTAFLPLAPAAGGSAAGGAKPPPCGVVGVDIALSRPLMVSAGADRAVRVWNLTGASGGGGGGGRDGDGGSTPREGGGGGSGGSDSGNSVAGGALGNWGTGGAAPSTTPAFEFAHVFSEPLRSISLHPSGTTLLVATDTAVAVCTLYARSLCVVKELPLRSCGVVRFNKAGTLFAAAAGTNISVFSTYEFALAVTLRGHAAPVVALSWGPDDRTLASADAGGSIILWAAAMPNAVAGGVVPVSPLAAFAPSVVVSAEAARAEGAGPPGGGTAFVGKVIARVDAPEFVPTAIAFGAGEREVLVAGIVKDAAAAGSGAPPRGVKFAAGSAGAGGGDGAGEPGDDALTPGPTLRVYDLSGGADAFGSNRGGGGRRPGAALGPKAVLPTGGVPLLVLATALLPISGAPGISAPQCRVLLAGMGARAREKSPLGSGSGGGGSAHVPFVVPTGGGGGSERGGGGGGALNATAVLSGTAELPLTEVAARALPHADPAGGLRAYRLPLPTAGASVGAAALPYGFHAVAGKASPFGFWERLAGHGGGCTAIAVAPGDHTYVATGGADGSVVLWALSPVPPPPGVVPPAPGGRPSSVAGAAAAAGGGSGEDGTSFAVGDAVGDPRASPFWIPWQDALAVPRADFDALRSSEADLTDRLSHLSLANKAAARAKEAEYGAESGALEERLVAEAAAARDALELARANKEEARARGAEALAALTVRLAGEVDAQRALYTARIAGESARLDRKVAEKEALVARVAATARAYGAETAALDAAAREAAAEEIAALTRECEALEADAAALARAGAARAGALGDDVDAEVEALRAGGILRVAAAAATSASLKAAATVQQKALSALNAELAEVRDSATDAASEESRAAAAILSLVKDVAGQRKELAERNALVEEKDARIRELKERCQELEKFKFVLNYKIQELKRQVLPRKRDIVALRATLREMELELLELHKSSSLLNLMLGELAMRRNGLRRAVAGLTAGTASQKERLANVQRDMRSLGAIAGAGRDAAAAAAAAAAAVPPPRSPGGAPQSPGAAGAAASDAGRRAAAAAVKVEQLLVGAYQKYIHGAASAGPPGDALPTFDAATGELKFPIGVAPDDVAAEVARNRGHLETAVGDLHRKLASAEENSAQGAARLMAQNTLLIGEVNDLRRGLRYAFAALSRAREVVGLPPLEPPALLNDATVAAPAEPEGPPRTPVAAGGGGGGGAAAGATAAAPPRALITLAASGRRTGAALGVVGAAGTQRPPSTAAAVPASPLALPEARAALGGAAGKKPAAPLSARSATAAGAAALKEKIAELRVGGGSIVL